MARATLRSLSYQYPAAAELALRAVDLELDAGLTALVGPSGGGKSTLLRLLNGLVPHFHGGRISGQVTVGGLDVLRTPTRRLAREVGFVFQDPELQAVRSWVEREVAFGLENEAVGGPALRQGVAEALARVGALHLAGRRLATLSGGERQRVALASALALRPQLLALDEPTSQLDHEGTELVAAACQALAAEGLAVVVAEHRDEWLGPLAQRTLLVEAGRVEDLGPAAGDRFTSLEPAAYRTPAHRGVEAWAVRGATVGPAGLPLLQDLDLAGATGEVLALTGPNGGGKTTLLRLLAGTLPPLSGAVSRTPGRVAFLPQNPAALLYRASIREELRATLDRAASAEPPEQVLGELGLLAQAERDPRDLSSGQRQRAAIAAVLAGSPRLALLDEPTRGMDRSARTGLRRLVGRLAAEGSAVIIATHDSQLVGEVCDRVLLVQAGTVREQPALRADLAPQGPG
ncbi:MAG: ABC transporter ATP-binding protein [Candidatus Dormibacter sp.]|uniref:ABC transporter ATP-binding protein n=1 Tax=Candidatus Dormibacter sp. TaxID=2973982 RepID=UPI000DB5B7E7|nr:MAG: ABC transporter [Candidatus Dormibacteraeota bacterium]